MCLYIFRKGHKYPVLVEPYADTVVLPIKESLCESRNSSQISKEILVLNDSPIHHIQRCSIDTYEYRYRISLHNKVIDAYNRRSISYQQQRS